MALEPIRTDVGAAAFGQNFVRGASVRDELFGRTTRWGLLSRLLGAPPLDAADAAFLDDVLVAAAAPDPRIWPLKIAWLIGAYGDVGAGGAAVQAMLAECRLGPWAGAAAFDTVSALAALREADPEGFADRAVTWIRARADAGEVVFGFGVAGGGGRSTDERLALIDEAARRHGYQDRRHYRAAREGAAAIARETGRQPNMAIGLAAIGLDLGLDRRRLEAILYELLEPQILGNAFEAAALRPAALRALPLDAVQYVGAPPRRSPRASGGAP